MKELSNEFKELKNKHLRMIVENKKINKRNKELLLEIAELNRQLRLKRK